MPLTATEKELRDLARTLIEERKLPGTIPAKMWGGFGQGEDCSLCSKTLKPEEVVYEIEEGDAEGNRPRAYRFHFLCHAAWQLECARADHLKHANDGVLNEPPNSDPRSPP